MKYLSLYVHIPFCKSKCYYCSFCSFANCENEQEKYFNVLCCEIEEQSEKYNNYMVNTIFIGGGTPSIVESKFIENVLKTIKKCFKITKKCEISIECNPDSVNEEKLIIYKKAGINRISFGVQSLNDNLLKCINRVHSSLQAIQAIEKAKQVGFKNINCDVMLGLPNQTKIDAINTVSSLINLGITHLSLYTLILEENTKLFNLVENKTVSLPTDDQTVEMFDECLKVLEKNNFIRYEVANFCKSGKVCKHNFGYWTNKNYVGFGLSSHSKIGNTRFCNTSNLNEYCKHNFLENTETLSSSQIREEKIMLGLRTNKGINLNLVKNKQDEIKKLVENGFVEIKNNHLIATTKGMYILNQIILLLI